MTIFYTDDVEKLTFLIKEKMLNLTDNKNKPVWTVEGDGVDRNLPVHIHLGDFLQDHGGACVWFSVS